MAILTLSDIIKLKELLTPYGVTLRTHDACGGQSFTLETPSGAVDENAHAALHAFLEARRLTARYFDAEKKDFTVR